MTVTLPPARPRPCRSAKYRPAGGRARFPSTEAGLHRLSDGKLDAVAAAGSADAREMSSLVATPAMLAPVAAATGGSVQWLEDGMPQLVKVQPGRQMAGSGWVGLKANGAHRVLAVSDIPLFATLLASARCFWPSAPCGTAKAAEAGTCASPDTPLSAPGLQFEIQEAVGIDRTRQRDQAVGQLA